MRFRMSGIFHVTIGLLLLSGCVANQADDAAMDDSTTREAADSSPPEVRDGATESFAAIDGLARAGESEASLTDAIEGEAISVAPVLPLPNTPGVVLRLEATAGLTIDGARVGRWADQSGHGHDAVQNDSGHRPTLGHATNGLAALHFSGKVNPADHSGDGGPYLVVKTAADFEFGADDWAIAAVVGYDNPLDGTHNGALGAFFGKDATPEIFFCGNWTFTETTERANLHIGFGESLPGLESDRKELNDGKVRVYLARRTKDKFELRVNGKISGQGGGLSGTNLSSPGVDIGIGSFSSHAATRSLRGDLLAMWVVRGSLSVAELDELEHYLGIRYEVAP